MAEPAGQHEGADGDGARGGISLDPALDELAAGFSVESGATAPTERRPAMARGLLEPDRMTAATRSDLTPRSGRLVAEIVPQGAIDAELRAAMWTLFSTYYEEVTEETFLADLSKKHDVILLKDAGDGSVQGFSTLMVLEKVVGGRRVVAVFSGDTIVSDAYWGQTALQRAFFRYIVTQKARNPFTAVYWFLISKGYRTYLLLSRNFPEYWPRHDLATPAWQADVLDALARELYPDAWKRDLGLLVFDHCAGRLKSGVAPIGEDTVSSRDVAFFAEKNPRHAEGDELCCLGRVDARLFLSYPLRLAGKLFRRVSGRRRALGAGGADRAADSATSA